MIGDVVKKLRRNKKIYQQDLADALSVSKSTVAMWETNKRTPDATMLVKIASFFDVSVDYLLGKSKAVEIAECIDISVECVKKNASSDDARIVAIEKISQLPDDKVDRLLGYLEALEEEK